MTETVKLPRRLLDEIFAHAQSNTASEACGLVSEKNGYAVTCYPVKNISQHPETKYEMDPGEQIDALRQMRQHGEELFGIYHSHPNSSAAPSATDISEANYPDVVYLIVSLGEKGVMEIAAYRIKNQLASALALEIGPE